LYVFSRSDRISSKHVPKQRKRSEPRHSKKPNHLSSSGRASKVDLQSLCCCSEYPPDPETALHVIRVSEADENSIQDRIDHDITVGLGISVLQWLVQYKRSLTLPRVSCLRQKPQLPLLSLVRQPVRIESSHQW
jgi:hypothetical protein